MDRAKRPIEPLRAVVIEKASESAPETPRSATDPALTRLFRMTPQVRGGVAERHTPLLAGQSVPTLRFDRDAPHALEPITQFFSSEELRSRAERINPPPADSGRFPDAGGDDPDQGVFLPYLWGPRLKSLKAIPPRRAVTLCAAALAGVVLLFGPELRTFLDSRRTPERAPMGAAPRDVRATRGASSPETAAPVAPPGLAAPPAGTSRSAEAPEAARPKVAVGMLAAEAPALVAAAPAAQGRSRAAGGHAATLERTAVDAVADGRYAAALDLYRRLSAENPSEASYRDAARILTDRLTAATR